MPAECTAKDPVWPALPDRDVTRSDGARHLDEAHARYERVLGRRHICRAAIQSLARSTK